MLHQIAGSGRSCCFPRTFLDPAVAGHLDLFHAAAARGPITILAAGGWRLLAGRIDRPLFATRRLRFNYRPPHPLEPR